MATRSTGSKSRSTTSSRSKSSKGGLTVREAGRAGGKKVQQERNLRDTKQVRGKAYDKPGPPKGKAFGIAAITQALEGLDFPVDKSALMKKAGTKTIEYKKGQPVSLKKVIKDLGSDQFPSMANVIESVSGALKAEGLSKRGRSAAPTAHT